MLPNESDMYNAYTETLVESWNLAEAKINCKKV